jgi:hypothetical protein
MIRHPDAFTRGAFLLGALTLSLCAWPAETPGRGDKGPVHGVPEAEEEVQELQIGPPRYPRDADLAEFTLRNPSPNHFYIDTTSISVEKDQIIRFVMVIRTPSKETNVRFSGLRCATREWKDYAFAADDKKWIDNPNANWKRIVELHYNNYQDTLFGDYFCLSGVLSTKPVGDAKKLAKLLRHPQQADPRIPFRKEPVR